VVPAEDAGKALKKRNGDSTMLNIVQRIPELIYLLFKNDGVKHWFPALYHGG